MELDLIGEQNNLNLAHSQSMMLPSSGQKLSSRNDHLHGHNVSYDAFHSMMGSASHSNVANPYQAAKIRYLLEQ
jgi:hypothetical protein